MDQRRRGEAHLAKQVVICAVLLVVSTGLCGVNGVLFGRFGSISGGESSDRSAGLSMFLMGTGAVEAAGMMAGALGLVILGVVWLARWIGGWFGDRESE